MRYLFVVLSLVFSFLAPDYCLAKTFMLGGAPKLPPPSKQSTRHVCLDSRVYLEYINRFGVNYIQVWDGQFPMVCESNESSEETITEIVPQKPHRFNFVYFGERENIIYNCHFVAKKYENGNLCLEVHSENGLVATASVEVRTNYDDDVLVINDYPEKFGMFKFLRNNEFIGEPFDRELIRKGGSCVSVRVCRLTQKGKEYLNY